MRPLVRIRQAFRNNPGEIDRAQWELPFVTLRRKWREVPASTGRLSTEDLLRLPEEELLSRWLAIREEATTGAAFHMRGWYHLIYQDVLKNKSVMDVGSGLGIDGITFAQHGARLTFVDIVESNLIVIQRLCMQLGLTDVRFCYLEDLSSLSSLPSDYDVIWCQGSLHHAPCEIIQSEAQELLKHLPVGGRWIQLAYPRARWEREGRMPFSRWGAKTDGEETPWVEWYDLDKVMATLSPAEFDVVLHFNFHRDEFNWFDLIRRG